MSIEQHGNEQQQNRSQWMSKRFWWFFFSSTHLSIGNNHHDEEIKKKSQPFIFTRTPTQNYAIVIDQSICQYKGHLNYKYNYKSTNSWKMFGNVEKIHCISFEFEICTTNNALQSRLLRFIRVCLIDTILNQIMFGQHLSFVWFQSWSSSFSVPNYIKCN